MWVRFLPRAPTFFLSIAVRYSFRMNKTLAWLAGILGIIFLGLAAYYWLTPAGSLPHFVPGFEAGSTHVHFKHGLASLILALGLFAFAWFTSAPQKDTTTASTPTATQ